MSKNIGSFIFQITCSGVWTNTFRTSSQQGDTPLMMATRKEMIDIVILLFRHGADICCRDQVNYSIRNTLNHNYFLCVILFENENNAFILSKGKTDMCNNAIVCCIWRFFC